MRSRIMRAILTVALMTTVVFSAGCEPKDLSAAAARLFADDYAFNIEITKAKAPLLIIAEDIEGEAFGGRF